MSVLTLRLAGPLQSWGASSRFARRSTEHAPTKSGVLGLLASAQGRQRTDDLTDLVALRFGVRVDKGGTRIRDYQTATHFDSGRSMPISERFYLSDAVFVAAVEGDGELIAALHSAVLRPVYLPYLGRRSCPPSRPIDIRVHEESGLEQALASEPWQVSEWIQRRERDSEVALDTVVDAGPDDARSDSLRDVPLSFAPSHRRYALRGLRHGRVRVPNPARAGRPSRHDPITALGGG